MEKLADRLTIIPATREDIPIILSLAQAIWPFTYREILSPAQIGYMMELFYTEEALKKQMLSHQFIIGYYREQPVAFASFSVTAEDSVFKLHKIYLSPALQGKGMGKQIINQVIEMIKPAGATHLQLNVNRSNPAIGFYQNLGFEKIRSEDIDIGEGFVMEDHVLELMLLPNEELRMKN